VGRPLRKCFDYAQHDTHFIFRTLRALLLKISNAIVGVITNNTYYYNMLREIDTFFDNKEEPVKGCLLFLRDYIQNSKAKPPHYRSMEIQNAFLLLQRQNGLLLMGSQKEWFALSRYC